MTGWSPIQENVVTWKFEIPGVMLGGTATEIYSIDEQRWHVTYTAAGREWTGIGEFLFEAYLDLIRKRLAMGEDR